MPETASVVTPARFEQGLSYADFLAQAAVNRDKFELNYRESPLSEDDLSFFRKAAALPNGPARILAIAEAWCGDVYRELPTFARIAEATGMTLRVFLRDQNPDIMDEFLSNEGKSRAIPVFVFYTDNLHYITHFTERSASAHAELASIMDQIKVELNLPPDATFANLPPADRQALLREMVAQIRPRAQQWQKDAIVEMRQLLSSALHIPNVG
jgi:Thioredoxin